LAATVALNGATSTFSYDNNGNCLTKSPGGKALSYI